MKNNNNDTTEKDIEIEGGALKLLRIIADINQTKVAGKLGMSRQNLDNIEKGTQTPKPEAIEKYILFLKDEGYTDEQIKRAQECHDNAKLKDLEQEVKAALKLIEESKKAKK